MKESPEPRAIVKDVDLFMARQIELMGFDDRMSATVSIWSTLDDLNDFTFNSLHHP